MQVLLINPSRTFARRKIDRTAVGLPVGLLYVASSLREAGHDVVLIDCLINPNTAMRRKGGCIDIGISDQVLQDLILKSKADVIGIGAPFTAQWHNSLRAVRLAKRQLPSAVIVLGGPHASIDHSEVLVHTPEVDFVVRGEGEAAFPSLLNCLSKGDSLNLVSGLSWRNKDGIIQSNEVVAIENLDALSLPAYDLVDKASFKRLEQIGIFSRSETPRAAEVITSRGCPYKCVFCSINISMGYRWRHHSVDNVIENINSLRHFLDVTHVHFEDDNFTFSKKRTKEMFEAFIERQLNISWDTPNGVRADTLDEDILQTAKQAGCKGLMVAAESGDQMVVNVVIKKNIKLSSIESAARHAFKVGIPMGSFYIVGFPGETKQNIKKTFSFALQLYRKYAVRPHFHAAAPLLGTELHRSVVDNRNTKPSLAPSDFTTASAISRGGLITTNEFGPKFIVLQYRIFLVKLLILRFIKIFNNRWLFCLNVIPASFRDREII